MRDVGGGHELGTADRRHGLARGDRGQPVVPQRRVQQHGAGQVGLHNRLGKTRGARLLQGEDQVDLVRGAAAVLLGDGDPQQADLGQAPPPVGREARLVAGRVPDSLGRARLLEDVADDAREQPLLLGEREAHDRLPPGQAEHALGDDVALDLVRARVDRAGEREQEAVR